VQVPELSGTDKLTWCRRCKCDLHLPLGQCDTLYRCLFGAVIGYRRSHCSTVERQLASSTATWCEVHDFTGVAKHQPCVRRHDCTWQRVPVDRAGGANRPARAWALSRPTIAVEKSHGETDGRPWSVPPFSSMTPKSS